MVTTLRIFSLFGWFVWILAYWRGGLNLLAAMREAVRSRRTRWDAALLFLLTFGSAVIAVGGLLFCTGLESGSSNRLLALLGSLLVWAGILGTGLFRRTLGSAWTAHTTVSHDLPLVDSGPYSVVRHPIYAAAIGLYAGLGLLFPAWWIALAALVVVAGYILKTRDEDAYLRKHLPGYSAYTQRVPYRLFPRIW
jgi:protein-S-isoprenylcysteine O-methyltransferase Ste14